jgi:hypothetical protein
MEAILGYEWCECNDYSLTTTSLHGPVKHFCGLKPDRQLAAVGGRHPPRPGFSRWTVGCEGKRQLKRPLALRTRLARKGGSGVVGALGKEKTRTRSSQFHRFFFLQGNLESLNTIMSGFFTRGNQSSSDDDSSSDEESLISSDDEQKPKTTDRKNDFLKSLKKGGGSSDDSSSDDSDSDEDSDDSDKEGPVKPVSKTFRQCEKRADGL